MEKREIGVRGHPDGSVVDIRVRPSSSRRGLEGLVEGRLTVCVHSPPEKGKANKEALKVLSEALGISPSRIEVLGGQSSRSKTVLVRDLSPAAVRERLGRHPSRNI
ncbi:MAG: DUF167 domain-containing protein [Actinomycetota bacterium]